MLSGQPYTGRRAIVERLLATALACALGTAASTCGGATSVTSITGPDAVRCQTSVSAQPTTVPPDGGTVALTVKAARDCTWTAASEAAWMQLSASSGQGEGSLTATVARNELPAVRSGAIVVGDQRLMVSQEPRPCVYELRSSSAHIGRAGGRGSVELTTLAGCAWTATSSESWVRVLTPSSNGPGTVEFEAEANVGLARETSILVAGLRFMVLQEPGSGGNPSPPPPPACTPSVRPTSIDVAAAGSSHSVTLEVQPSCDWSASVTASWIMLNSPATGRGNATVAINVARNTGAARTGTLTVAQQNVTVAQAAAPACTFSIDPSALDFAASGGEGRVHVTTQQGCAWTSSGGSGWVSFTTSGGTGSGDARYTVSANTAASSRATSLTIAGRTHSVSQQAAAPTCTYTLNPTSLAFTPAGGEGRVRVTTQAGCAWTASGGADWATITIGQGTGSGEFVYSVQANTASSPRSTTITTGGQSHAVTQAGVPTPTCTYALQPASLAFTAAGGEGRLTMTAPAGCAWTASSGADWIVVSGGSGTGAGEVVYTVQPNSATSPRSTTITAGGQTHAVTQEAAAPTPCTYSLQPASQSFTASGGEGRFNVVTQAGCAWSAVSGASWVTVSAGSGAGAGEVVYSVQANSVTETRSTAITVNGQTHAVMQEAAAPPPPPPPPPCTYAIDPAERKFGSAGGEGVVQIITGSHCTWTASSGASWVTLLTSSGTGSGELRYQVAPNTTDDDRETTIAVAGQTHRVQQEDEDDDRL